MFHLQSLELLHWDYCQRVTLPLDAAIVTIAGPNGSGKTTLLDAMRTLLGLPCSHPRDFKTYARHAGANTAWLRAVVDNRAKGRQTSNRPFARRLMYSDQVTLACRIERNGGDWQRYYLMVEGDCSIEKLTELTQSGDKNLQKFGPDQWRKAFADAGLSAAIARVLSLEQGQTDRLCELSPKQLLTLVFNVFGDQEVLNGYATAREHQQHLAREMQAAERELDHSKAQLAELSNKVNNYLSWQAKIQERESLATEVLPVMQWAQERESLHETSLKLRKQRHSQRSLHTQARERQAQLLALLQSSEKAKAEEDALSGRVKTAYDDFQSAREAELPVENLLKEKASLEQLASAETDSIALQSHLEKLRGELQPLEIQRLESLQKQDQLTQDLYRLEGQKAPQLPPEARQLRQRLQDKKIAHSFIAEIASIESSAWRNAIEGVMRPHRWVVLLENASDLSAADSIASQLRYRHYLVSPTQCQSTEGLVPSKASEQCLVDHLRFEAPIPDWLLRQLQQLRCVVNPEQGRKTSGHWITPEAYSFDGRGARSLWIESRDHQFGAAAVASRREALENDLFKLESDLTRLLPQISSVKAAIGQAEQSLKGHKAAEKLAQRSSEFEEAASQMPLLKNARAAASTRWQNLQLELTQASKTTLSLQGQYTQLQDNLRRQNREAESAAQDMAEQRRQLDANISQSRHTRDRLPPAWRSADKLAQLRETYTHATQARIRLGSVENELKQGHWEQDASVQERYHRMGVTVREQDASLQDHLVKNSQAAIAVGNARESYIEVLRSTVRRYRNNIQQLGALAGVDVSADLPALENDDTVLSQAGLKVNFNFDGKGSIGLNDGEASGGQQVIKSLILLVGLLKDEENASGGFVFIDEPFAHLDVRNIQLVGHFLRSTQAQYVLTTPITHNLEVFEPAEITLVTQKKSAGSRWAPPIAVAKRRRQPTIAPLT